MSSHLQNQHKHVLTTNYVLLGCKKASGKHTGATKQRSCKATEGRVLKSYPHNDGQMKVDHKYATELLALLLHIREVLGSNLGLETRYIEVYHGFPQSFQEDTSLVL